MMICFVKPATGQEVMPDFKGGPAMMYKYVYEHIKYPVQARKNGVSGTVIIQFVVNDQGNLTDIQVVKGPGSGLDEEAIRVVNLMNEEHMWIPATKDGRPVSVTFTLPIRFGLQ